MDKAEEIAEACASYFDAADDEEFIDNLKKDLNNFANAIRAECAEVARKLAKGERQTAGALRGGFKWRCAHEHAASRLERAANAIEDLKDD